MIFRALLILILISGCARTRPAATDDVSSSPDTVDVASRPDTSVVPIIAYWDVGEEHTLEVVKGSRTYEGDTLVESDSSVTLYYITVIDSTEDSYIVQWRPEGDIDYETLDMLGEVDVDESMLELLAEEGLIIMTSETGEYLGLVNGDDLVAVTSEIMDAFFDQMMESDTTMTALSENPEAMAMMQELLGAFASKDFLEAQLTEDIQLYHMWYGYEYATSGVVEYEEELPSLFGGDPVPARGTFEVDGIDWEEYLVSFVSMVYPDAGALRAMVQSVFEEMPAMADADIDAELEKIGFNMYDANRFVIDFGWGWVLYVDRVRTVEAEGKIKEQYVTMRMLD